VLACALSLFAGPKVFNCIRRAEEEIPRTIPAHSPFLLSAATFCSAAGLRSRQKGKECFGCSGSAPIPGANDDADI